MATQQESVAVKAKRYSSIKYSIAIIDTLYILLLLFLFQGLGISQFLAREISKLATVNYFIVPAYVLTVFILYYLWDFPLNFYRSFVLEHRFCLSAQKAPDWFKDQLKAAAIAYVITLILLAAFYYILARYPNFWWLVVSLFWIFFGLILAKITPVIIIPLFFKYTKLSDGVLRERILALADKMKVRILDVFQIDFSKKTLKANAAFVGWGKSRRVILADTLKDKYSFEEIEVILAHEFAHYKLKHLIKLVLINSVAIILSFYFIYRTGNFALKFYGLFSFGDIAALPLILIYMTAFGVILQPFQNYLSRVMERNADMLALKITGLKEPFISMMEKLSLQNLADRNPHPLIKIFFFDHPPIDERINMAKSL